MAPADQQMIFRIDPPGEWSELAGLWVSGDAAEFLAQAGRGRAGGLVVYLEGGDLAQRQAAVDLCAALTDHPVAGRLPLAAVVWRRHRGLLASLELARRFVPVMQRTLAELQRRAADIPGWPPENSRPDIGGN